MNSHQGLSGALAGLGDLDRSKPSKDVNVEKEQSSRSRNKRFSSSLQSINWQKLICEAHAEAYELLGRDKHAEKIHLTSLHGGSGIEFQRVPAPGEHKS